MRWYGKWNIEVIHPKTEMIPLGSSLGKSGKLK